jgi:ABC-type sugar transport system ATPase subunit
MTKNSADAGANSQSPLLEMRGIVKRFGRVEVLHGVDLTLYAGEVHALLGENGAGKSTLMKILSGDYIPDGGTVTMGGSPVNVRSPRDAEAAGIRIIHQELNYAGELSVAENVLLGHLPRRKGALGWVVDWPAAYRRSAEILATLKADIDPQEKMGNLGVGKKQLVEIAKALSSDVRVLVMDEPTAALTSREVHLLFETIALLRERGVAIVYISHRLDEVEEIAQRLTVLRDGNLAGVISTGNISRADIVRLMVGRPMEEMYPQREGEPGEPVLEVTGLSKARAFQDVSFTIRKGEIVGLYGLLGAGQAEVARALFGSPAADAGQVKVGGQPVRVGGPRDAKKSGIGLVPDDRKVDGLILGMSVADNMMLGNWASVTSGGVFQPARESARVGHWSERLGIRMASAAQPIGTLSGGNQQKAVLARWLEAGTKVLLLAEPTRGIDVGARADIYNVIEELRRQGLSLALISTDMEEVLALSDRIVVFAQGRVVGTFTREEANQDVLLAAAAGIDSRE